MPARLDVDREAVKTLVVAIGVREAARRMNLPEATVQAWSARFGWVRQSDAIKAEVNAKRLQPTATKPSIALAETISDNCVRARVALSKTALNAGQAFEKLKGKTVIGKDKSTAFRNITAATAQIGGWDQDKGKGGVNVAVNVGIIG